MKRGRRFVPRALFAAALLATGFAAVLPAAAAPASAAPASAAPASASPASAAGKVRPPALAGSWYPERRSLVEAEVDRMVRAAAGAPALPGPPVALVVPHAGWRYSGFAAAAVFRNLRPGDFDRVVVVAPSHTAAFAGFAVPEVSAFRTPAGEIPLCQDVMKRLDDGRLVRPVAGAHDREHSIEIELPFLQERLERFCLVPILAGQTDAGMQRDLAARLARLRDRKTLFVFSSDFTHYGPRYAYTPFGPSARAARRKIRDLDERAIGLLAQPDAAGFRAFLEETGDSICGREGLLVMLELLPRIAPEAKAVRIAQYASIDIPDVEDDNSVTYVALAFVAGAPPAGAPPAGGPSSAAPLGPPPPHPACRPDAPPLDADLGGRLLRVARATLGTELQGTDDLSRALRDLPASARETLNRLQGTFVTLKRTDPREIARFGRLRGCIGQVSPVYPLAEAVVVAAANAALADSRFEPVRAEELTGLRVELTVLSPMRPIGSWKEIRLGRHGILLAKGGHRAVFLPEVPVEEGWTLEETLSRLSRKGGLPEDAWREGATFEVFEGQVFEEHHAAGGADAR